MHLYEPQAAELLTTLGLSVAEEASPEHGESVGKVVPRESVQALSAAMSLVGGGSGVSAEVRGGFFILLFFVLFDSVRRL